MNGERDIEFDAEKPVVATDGPSNWGLYTFIAILLLGGTWLFATLNAAREPESGLATITGADRISSPPPLVLQEVAPRLPLERSELPPVSAEEDSITRPAPVVLERGPSPPVAPPPVFEPPLGPPPMPVAPPQPSVVFERAFPGGALDDPTSGGSSDAIRATRLANPSFTITQGTIIPAVLETAFNSTRPGGVRALVQRDIHAFDGSRVLIPRGSRLFGEYDGGLNPGERRALIRWTRLMRPDGVSIPLDSPASDPLGRGGVEGDVDTQFWGRLGDGLLNTVLGLGVGVVAGEVAGGSTILALPGSTQNVAGSRSSSRQPTLEIDHGTSVSVYVARDLDFSAVDR